MDSTPQCSSGSLLSAQEMTPELQAKLEANRILLNKNWSELTADEKIERTRDQVKYRIDCLERTNRSQKRKIDKLMKHSHDGQDRMVSPISEYDNEESLGGYERGNNDWF